MDEPVKIEERRAAERYAIERDVRWKLQGRRTREAPAVGRTINISSAGVLFTTESPVASGKLIEIAISWPVPSDGGDQLQLIAKGKLVRCLDGAAAVEFKQREFRARHTQL